MADTVFDIHVEVLKSIDAELVRLHRALDTSSGDEDAVHEQINDLNQELIRLSNALSDAECESHE